jgi:hypothetical protein
LIIILAGIIALLITLIVLQTFAESKELVCLRLYKDINELSHSDEMSTAESETVYKHKVLIFEYVEKACPDFQDLKIIYNNYKQTYPIMDGEISSEEIVIGIPHALPVEPKQSETPESLLAQFEILANENLILQDQRILKMQEIDDARANKSNSISTLEAELDVINEKLKQSGIKLDQIRTATSKFYEIDSQLKATLEKARQILTDNHNIIPWNGLGIDPKSKTLLIEFESSDLADKYAPVIRELIGEDIPITIFVGKNTFD